MLCVEIDFGMDPRVKPTAVRFKYVDGLHGIDSTCDQAFGNDLDTREDHHHAASQ